MNNISSHNSNLNGFSSRSAKQTLIGALILIAGQASASWNDGGKNVISFDSGNPEKNLYTQHVHSSESGRSYSYYDWNDFKDLRAATDIRNVTSFKPGTFYSPATIRITPIASGSFVYSNASVSSSGAACGTAGQTCSAAINLSIGRTNCVSHEVQIGLTGEFAPMSWTPSLASVGTGSYTRGWSQCQNSTQGHSCAGVRISGVRTLNYATTEARTRIGWTKMGETTTVNTATYRGNNLPSDFKPKCAAAGGSYQKANFLLRDDVHTCTINNPNKLTWEEYGNWPATLNSVDANCRVIEDK
jgi:hypothetical protein